MQDDLADEDVDECALLCLCTRHQKKSQKQFELYILQSSLYPFVICERKI